MAVMVVVVVVSMYCCAEALCLTCGQITRIKSHIFVEIKHQVCVEIKCM